jgi:hypothetical protein
MTHFCQAFLLSLSFRTGLTHCLVGGWLIGLLVTARIPKTYISGLEKNAANQEIRSASHFSSSALPGSRANTNFNPTGRSGHEPDRQRQYSAAGPQTSGLVAVQRLETFRNLLFSRYKVTTVADLPPGPKQDFQVATARAALSAHFREAV